MTSLTARRCGAAALAFTMLAACSTPYTDAIRTQTEACTAGASEACKTLVQLHQADDQYRSERADKWAAGAAILLLGIAAAGAAYSASQPTYYQPTYYRPINCTSSTIGFYTNTNCY